LDGAVGEEEVAAAFVVAGFGEAEAVVGGGLDPAADRNAVAGQVAVAREDAVGVLLGKSGRQEVGDVVVVGELAELAVVCWWNVIHPSEIPMTREVRVGAALQPHRGTEFVRHRLEVPPDAAFVGQFFE
jgi:hypothetical protein